MRLNWRIVVAGRELTDPDIESTVRKAADAYLTSTPNTTHLGCRRSGITVYSAGSAQAAAGFHDQSDPWQRPVSDDLDPQRDFVITAAPTFYSKADLGTPAARGLGPGAGAGRGQFPARGAGPGAAPGPGPASASGPGTMPEAVAGL